MTTENASYQLLPSMEITNTNTTGRISITIDYQVSFSLRVPYLRADPLPFEPLVSAHQAARLVMTVLSAIISKHLK